MKERIVAGGVVVGPGGKIVIVEQKGNSWSFPKGGIDPGETPLDAARREVLEETGIAQLKYKADLGSYSRLGIGKDGIGEDTSRPPNKRIFFLFHTTQQIATYDGDETTDARFVTIGEALSLLTHQRDRLFLKSIRGIVEQYNES